MVRVSTPIHVLRTVWEAFGVIKGIWLVWLATAGQP